MKKSNIILLGIFLILLLAIASIQFRVKSYLETIELNEIDIPVGYFSEIEAKPGWYIELFNDPNIKITISSDSIKNYLSVQDNKLILDTYQPEDKPKIAIKIFNPHINKIKVEGNSKLYYYLDSVDSLHLTLKDKSNCTLTNKKTRITDKQNTIEKGKISFLDIMVSDKSSINIHCDLKELQGELNDSSYCHMPGEVMIKNFKKSKNANINSW